jgi:hypothetical protein
MIPTVTASEVGKAHSRIPLSSTTAGSCGVWNCLFVTDRPGYATPLDCGLPIAGERPIVVASCWKAGGDGSP